MKNVLNDAGASLLAAGRYDEAVAQLTKAIERQPPRLELYGNLGLALGALGRRREALVAFERCVALAPASAPALLNYGACLQELGSFEAAVDAFSRAIALAPTYAEAHANLAGALQKQGRIKEAIASYRSAVSLAPHLSEARSNLLLCTNYDESLTPKRIFDAHLEWQRFAAVQAGPARLRDRDPERRLRVGYVSSDLREHSVASFFEPLLRAHDRAVVEPLCYSNVRRPDQTTERLRALAATFVDVTALSDAQLAERIAADGVDVLVDLNGHTARHRLGAFARRAAPVQVTWLGYPNTTGLSEMDYRLTDALADPAGAEEWHTERLARLDGGFLCYAPPPGAPEPGPPLARERGHVTFGSFNNLSKLTPRTIKLWSSLLRQLPSSRLLLKGKPLADPPTRARFVEAFARQGVDEARLDLLGALSERTHHLAVYHQVDVALDPLNYNGTTTTFEALHMGVPVVTLAGDRHAARVGRSILTRLGLPELVAEDAQGFLRIASSLARDHGRLATLRGELRARLAASPLCDASGFARAIEASFRAMWRERVLAP